MFKCKFYKGTRYAYIILSWLLDKQIKHISVCKLLFFLPLYPPGRSWPSSSPPSSWIPWLLYWCKTNGPLEPHRQGNLSVRGCVSVIRNVPHFKIEYLPCWGTWRWLSDRPLCWHGIPRRKQNGPRNIERAIVLFVSVNKISIHLISPFEPIKNKFSPQRCSLQ